MSKVTQYSRISHHTIAGSASAGLTFSVPPQEDFTDGSWTPFDLALSEIGVNEEDEKVFIRIDDEIKEFAFIGASGVGFTGGAGNCITDLYVTNIFGCSPITIHDDFIQKDGTSINSEDGDLQITFDSGGVGTFDVQITDGSDYLTQILSTTQSTIINTEDLLTPKQGKLEVDRNFTYFAHFDGSSGSLSYIQAQDDTIDIQTQTSGGTLHQINMDSTGDTMNFITTATGGEFASIDLAYNPIGNETTLALRSEDAIGQFAAIDLSHAGTIFNTPLISLVCDDGSTSAQAKLDKDKVTIGNGVADVSVGFVSGVTQQTGSFIRHSKNTLAKYYDFGVGSTPDATPITIGTIDFSIGGLTDRVITVEANVTGVGPVVNLGYGAKLFAVFKSIGGVITQLSTTDKSEKTDFLPGVTSDIIISGTDIIIQVTGQLGTDISWATDFSYTTK